MARLTKNSYKRKIIVFGLLVFMSIALISTGFAAWIMSQEAKQEVDGNVSVGVVNDSRMQFSIDSYQMFIYDNNDAVLSKEEYAKVAGNGEIPNLYFLFEPRYEDNLDPIKWDKNSWESNNIVNFEILKLKVVGRLSNVQLLANGQFSVSLSVTEGVHNCIQPIDNDDHRNDGKSYINLKDFTYSESKNNLYIYTKQVTPDSTTGYFEFEVEFEWGSIFNNQNPAKSTDDNNITNSALDVIKADLEEFRAILLGYFNDTKNESGDVTVKGLKSYNDEIDYWKNLIANPDNTDDGKLSSANKYAKITEIEELKQALIEGADDNNKYELVMKAVNG